MGDPPSPGAVVFPEGQQNLSAPVQASPHSLAELLLGSAVELLLGSAVELLGGAAVLLLGSSLQK